MDGSDVFATQGFPGHRGHERSRVTAKTRRKAVPVILPRGPGRRGEDAGRLPQIWADPVTTDAHSKAWLARLGKRALHRGSPPLLPKCFRRVWFAVSTANFLALRDATSRKRLPSRPEERKYINSLGR